MSDVSIRPASPADIPAIARIYGQSVLTGTASFELEPPDEAEMLRRMRALLDGGFPYIAAEIGGAVVGYAYAGPYRTRPAYRFTVEDSIYIDPAAQRRGVGRVLLKNLIEESTRRGFRLMVAVIGDSAQVPSIELHRAMGFEMVGTFENIGFKFDRWLDSVLMQLPLGEGATTKPTT
ncbi:MAG: N-acetyltransferase family protein [Alphaproteobacteria bacterium]|nr:N-acetyltransferase family protein [Alphaproteobacteria bacterium]